MTSPTASTDGEVDTRKPSDWSVRLYPVYAGAGVAGVAIGLIDAMISRWTGGAKLLAVIYGGMVVFLALIAVFKRPATRRAKSPRKGLFRGAGRIQGDQSWLRDEERKGISDLLEGPGGKPVVLVGSSGVGKTVLLESQVIPFLKAKQWTSVVFSNYDGFENEAYKELSPLFPGLGSEQFLKMGDVGAYTAQSPLLIVFDQFEQFLSAHSQRHDKAVSGPSLWFRTLVRSLMSNAAVRCVIVVRKEWFYDLRFLDRIVPPPFEARDLSGIGTNRPNAAQSSIKANLNAVTKNAATTEIVLKALEEDGEILPVRAQIVGLMLENYNRKHGEISADTFHRLGGCDGLVDACLRQYVNASPNRDVTSAVLFALSVETRLRGQLGIGRITAIVHKPNGEVQECLKFLSAEGLASETPTGKYELAHDYLAERFHELSGTLLDPVERDNLLFFWDETRKQPNFTDYSIPKAASERGIVFSDAVLTFLALMLIARLFGPAYGWSWGWVNVLATASPPTGFLDVDYLPVFVAHSAWAIYVSALYRGFFSLIPEKGVKRLLSTMTVVVCAGSVLFAVFKPYYWLVSIGVGGLAVGFKLLQLSRSCRHSEISASFFRKTAVGTIVNLIIVLLFGSALVYSAHQGPLPSFALQVMQGFSFGMSAVMTYYMIMMVPLHITSTATSRMLGVVDRDRLRASRMPQLSPPPE